MLITTSKIVALCSLSNLINTADRALMPIAIIQIAKEYNLTLKQQGLILSSYPFGYFSSQIIGAKLSKKYGGKNVLTLSVLLWSLLTILTPLLASSVLLLIISRILLGIIEGTSLPAIVHIYSTLILNDERSRAFSYLISFGSIGQTLVALICPYLKWKLMFILFGLFGLIWCLFWLLLFKKLKLNLNYNNNIDHYDDDDYIIVQSNTFNYYNNNNNNVSSTSSSNNNNNNRINYYLDYFKYKQLLCIYVAHFSMNLTMYLITSWLPTYLFKIFNINEYTLSLTALPYVFNSLFGILNGHFADSLIMNKWSILKVRRLMTSIGLLGPAFCLFIFIFTDNLLLAIM
jgi:MFS family permease